MRNPAHILKKRFARIVIRIQSLHLYKFTRRALNPKIMVVEANTSDWAEVQKILNPNTADPPPPIGSNSTNYVAKIGDNVVGHVQLVALKEGSGIPEGLWLFSLGVRLKYRRLGIGELLSCRVVQAARERGAPELYLLVFENNQPAVKLYRKLGFKQQTLPTMEETLEKEERIYGRRRVVMGASLREETD
jgi:ribosomal protein S18 acetylase RimI-like enzyme